MVTRQTEEIDEGGDMYDPLHVRWIYIAVGAVCKPWRCAELEFAKAKGGYIIVLVYLVPGASALLALDPGLHVRIFIAMRDKP